MDRQRRRPAAAILIHLGNFKPTACVAIYGMVMSFGAACEAQQPGPSWPTRPVRLVVPFPAAGFSDLLVRVVTPRLAEHVESQIARLRKIAKAAGVGPE